VGRNHTPLAPTVMFRARAPSRALDHGMLPGARPIPPKNGCVVRRSPARGRSKPGRGDAPGFSETGVTGNTGPKTEAPGLRHVHEGRAAAIYRCSSHGPAAGQPSRCPSTLWRIGEPMFSETPGTAACTCRTNNMPPPSSAANIPPRRRGIATRAGQAQRTAKASGSAIAPSAQIETDAHFNRPCFRRKQRQEPSSRLLQYAECPPVVKRSSAWSHGSPLGAPGAISSPAARASLKVTGARAFEPLFFGQVVV